MTRHVWCKQPRADFGEIKNEKPYSNRGRENRCMKILDMQLAEIWKRGEPKRNRR